MAGAVSVVPWVKNFDVSGYLEYNRNKGVTHYIEVFASNNLVIHGPCQPIANLPLSLKITANSKDLKTIAVWKIRMKP